MERAWCLRAPNAGKSSLFNAILRKERAIVTPHAGTTRDSLEAVVDLNGIPLTLIDTAGLRSGAGEIEAIGIERSRREMESADIVLFIVDSTAPAESTPEYKAIQDLPHLLVFNKADLVAGDEIREGLASSFAEGAKHRPLFASATRRDGIEAIENAILTRLGARRSEGGSSALITSGRHAAALGKAVGSLKAATEGMTASLSPDLVVIDLQAALSEIDSILGRTDLDEDILDAVFATFCLGK
jgi:tRNA modification GTPase